MAAAPEFDVWVASRCLEDVEVHVEVQFISIRSGKQVAPLIERRVCAQANATTEILQGQKVQLSTSGDWFLAATSRKPFDPESHDPFVIYATLRRDGVVVATDTAWPQPYKYLDFADRGVRVEMAPSGDKITVTAELPVVGFVLDEVEGLTLSDNGFDIMPGEEHVIEVDGYPAAGLGWTYLGAESRGTVQMSLKSRL